MLSEVALNALRSVAKRPDDKITIKDINYLSLFKMIFNDWLTNEEWLNEGKPKDVPHLYVWQEELIKDVFQPLIDNYEKDDFHVRIAMAGAYGVGKSAALAIIIIMHLCYCYMFEKHRKYKGSVYSGSESQLRTTLWDEVRIFSNHVRGLVHECRKMFIDRKALGDNDPHDINYYCITAETLNTENEGTKRGKHGGNVLVVFDEGTNMSDKMYDTVDSFGTNARRVWIVMSNPTTTVGRFYQLFVNEFYKNIWLTKHISVFDSYPEGHTYANEKIMQYGEDSDDVRVCVYGLFPQKSVGAIFPQYLIDEAMAKNPINLGTICCMGIDLATERGKDYSAIAVKRPMSYVSVEKYKMDVMSFINQVVKPAISRLNPCFVALDRGGIGEMAAQELAVFCKSYNIRFIPVDFGGAPPDRRYINIRTYLLFKIKDRLMDGYSLPQNQELAQEMSWLTFGNDYGRIKAVSKKDLPKSTDLLDAIALTESADLINRDTVEHNRHVRKYAEKWGNTPRFKAY